MQKLQQGDFALVTRCKDVRMNEGSSVKLLCHLEKGETYSVPGAHRQTEFECWLVVGRVYSQMRRPDGVRIFEYGYALLEEKHLMPLRGDFRPTRDSARRVSE